MRIFYSEFRNDYSSYTFFYVPYYVFESIQNHSRIYNKGFLPYTGDPEMTNYLYYMARSLRVNLSEFSLISENRRVLRRFEEYTMNYEWIRKNEFSSYVRSEERRVGKECRFRG